MLLAVLIALSPGELWLQSAEDSHWAQVHNYHLAAEMVSVNSAGRLPPPAISYSYAGSPVETRNGPVNGQLMVTQRIPWPGELAVSREISELQASAADLQIWEGYLSARTEIARLWSDVYRNQENYKRTLERHALLESLLLSASGGSSVGSLNPGALTDLTIRVELSRLQVETDHRLFLNSVLQLELYSESSVDSLSPLPASEWFIQRIDVEPSQVPGIALAELEVEQKMLDERLVSALRYPDFTAGLSWSIIDAPEIQAGAVEAGRDAWMVSLGMSIPLGYSGYDARESAARLRTLSKEENLDAVRIEVQQDLEMLSTRITNISDEIELLAQLLPVARNSSRNAASGWSSGVGSYSTLISALETELSIEQAITEKQVQLIVLTAQWLEIAGIDTQEGEFL